MRKITIYKPDGSTVCYQVGMGIGKLKVTNINCYENLIDIWFNDKSNYTYSRMPYLLETHG